MGHFFVAGGTLGAEAQSYIERSADRKLLDALRQGEFSYVLDSRQKGKSSLMVRTRKALADEGMQTVLLDLQRFGSNLAPEQWYGSMLLATGQELGLEDRLLELWDAQTHAGPMQRFFGALEQAAAALSGGLVVFVDEIDYVRSLPFRTDEFFAGIRECYNRRASGAGSSLTFCLLGVATPSELIRDVQITPFNVGRRIDLTDFTPEDLAGYAAALGSDGRNGRALTRRIHYWTGGHPYLTQKLASAVASDPKVRTAGGVDRLVESIFFSVKARTEEPNLSDVSRRVLESSVEGVNEEEARSRVLDLYRQVREGQRIRDDETDPVVSVLKLAGLTRVLEGYLVVRNRVYFRAFDRGWIESNLPGAELARQKRVARTAALRVGVVAGAIVLAFGGLAAFATSKAQEASKLAVSESAARDIATQRAAEAEKSREEAATRAQEAERAREESEQAGTATQNALVQAQEQRERANMQAEVANRANERTSEALARATRERDRAESSRRDAVAERERSDALAQSERLARHQSDRLLYEANMNLIPDAFTTVQFGRVQSYLDETAQPHLAQFKGLEWSYWDYRMNTQKLSIQAHVGATQALFSPDGTKVLTRGQADGTARLWDARTGRETVRIQGHTGMIRSALFSPDGAYIVTASDDRTARIWNVDTGRETARFVGHSGPVRRAELSPDNTVLVTSSDDGAARTWSVETRRETAKMVSGDANFQTVNFTPDGVLVVTSSDNGTARIWDLGTGRKVAEMEGHSGRIYNASFSPDRSKLLTSSADRTARVWNVRTGQQLSNLAGHSGDVIHASFSPDGTRVVTTSYDQTAQVWDLESGRRLYWVWHHWLVYSARFSPDGTRFVTASHDGSARVWDTKTGNEIVRLEGHTGLVWTAWFSSDGTQVVTGSSDGTARIWDVRVRREIVGLQNHAADIFNNRSFKGDFSPDNTQIATGGLDGVARLWDVRTGREIIRFEGHSDLVTSASFSRDGTRVVTSSWDNTARVWNAKTGTVIAKLDGHTRRVVSASFSIDGEWVVTGSIDRTARIWDARTGRETVRLEGHEGAVLDASFSPDGMFVVTGSTDNTARIWEARTGQTRITTLPHGTRVVSAVFSPDGTMILTGSYDRWARIWDANSGKELSIMMGHTNLIYRATLSADGRRVVTAGRDRTARVWDSDSGRELLRLSLNDEVGHVALSSDDRLLLAITQAGIRLLPLSREGAEGLTFVQEDRWIADQLSQSAAAGDLFAWKWQTENWLTPALVESPSVRAALERATASPHPEIKRDASSRLLQTTSTTAWTKHQVPGWYLNSLQPRDLSLPTRGLNPLMVHFLELVMAGNVRQSPKVPATMYAADGVPAIR